MMGKEIAVYTATGPEFIEETDTYYSIISVIAKAIGDEDQAQQLIERCENEGKRLIFYYPPSSIDTSGWEQVGEIEDGVLYIG